MNAKIDDIQCCEQLHQALARIDISVPGRIDGRTTEHTEIWTICRLLSTLGSASELNYPISLVHRDRPDFLLRQRKVNCGIEVTEAISTDFAAFCAFADREYPDANYDISNFRWGSRKLSVDEMRGLLTGRDRGSDGWSGDVPEMEWARYVESIVSAKIRKFSDSNFEKFDRNWLAIYDNLPLAYLNLESAISHLSPYLENYWSQGLVFDQLLIEHGPVIAKLTRDDIEYLELDDLWQ